MITGAGAITVTINGVNATNGYTNQVDPVDSDGSINNSTTASTKALGLNADVDGNAIKYTSAWDGSKHCHMALLQVRHTGGSSCVSSRTVFAFGHRAPSAYLITRQHCPAEAMAGSCGSAAFGGYLRPRADRYIAACQAYE